MPLAEQIIRGVLGAFLGTVGFAMLVHTPRRAWLASGLIAVFSYLVYWLLVTVGFSDPSSIFLGSLFGSLAGQICARKMKIIGTVYLMSAVVPVVVPAGTGTGSASPPPTFSITYQVSSPAASAAAARGFLSFFMMCSANYAKIRKNTNL